MKTTAQDLKGTGASKALTLQPQHQHLITASGISPDVAKARGYRTVTTKAELKRLGFGDAQRRVPALVIPIYNVHGKVATYQVRPDEPRTRDGKPIKYETKARSRMSLDVPPGARAWLGHPTRPLFITEGARKADAGVSHGLCCIALLGVWNWRGRNADGGMTALADWESIHLKGRLVYIAFDSDVMLKLSVHAALVRLKAFLEGRGSEVRTIYLPPAEGGAKQGLDDFFAAGHTVEDLLALSTDQLRVPPGSSTATPRPPSYRATPKGLVWDRPTTRNGFEPTLLTNFCATITREVLRDDGVDSSRVFRVEAHLGTHKKVVNLAAEDIRSPQWALDAFGAAARVYPRTREHLFTAIQTVSGTVRRTRVFAHLGWRRLRSGWSYLHAGGAIGTVSGAGSPAQPEEVAPANVPLDEAITASGTVGPVSRIKVELLTELARMALPPPPARPDLRSAIRASLTVLDVASDVVTIPVYATMVRAVLGGIDFSTQIAGPTGAGKTALAALLQQHFGPEMDASHLPASWNSTANANELLAFHAKDALLVVDDFAPTGSQYDVDRAARPS